MKTMGLFEAKNRFSGVCDEVAKSGEPLVVTRRGKPLVRIVRVDEVLDATSVWDSVEESVGRYGPLPDDWELPSRSPQLNRADPLGDIPS